MALTATRATFVSPRAPSKAAQLRALLTSPELSFLMEAHNGLSAKIVEEAGFKGIWASGFTMSASLGVRDSNEASWTQVLEILEFMADATTIPILLDGDTGYGNFNNMRRLVAKLCQRGIAGVCVEDKLFPKTNSFLGEAQPLADIEEFCGKIKAGKDSQTDDDFCIVARVEALISGWGLEEALRRAEAYRGAGADAILIHSKRSTADEVLAFSREWGRRLPVVIVPTMYYATPTRAFHEAGISTVIWANHNLRAAITAMREVSRHIREEQSLLTVEEGIASVQDVFELAGNPELAQAERRYLPIKNQSTRAIVLAASRGEPLGKLTLDRPKCMIDIRGEPLLFRLVSTFRSRGVGEITVIRGYRKEMINLPAIRTRDNDDYAVTGEAASLACAIDRIEGHCLVTYGDILFRHYILDRLFEAEGDIVLVADAHWYKRGFHASDRHSDLVSCSTPFTGSYLEDPPVMLRRISGDLAEAETHGEWIGLAKLSPDGAEVVRAHLEAMRTEGGLSQASLPELFTRLIADGQSIHVMYITGHWLDVDDAFDLAKARNFP